MKEDNIFANIFMVLFFGGISLILWVPLIALLLWAVTFISNITFSWVFVLIISSVLGVISGIIMNNE